MYKMPNKLICITGFKGHGKSTTIKYLKNIGYKTFEVDKWVHQIYKKHKKGYILIKKLFGNGYVTDLEVDRLKLKELIISSPMAKKKLEKNMNKLIYKRINQLKRHSGIVFVELATYLFFKDFFANLFDKTIVINNPNKEENEIFRKNSNIKKFSTKTVGNSNNVEKMGIFYCDFLVENTSTIENLKKELFNLVTFL